MSRIPSMRIILGAILCVGAVMTLSRCGSSSNTDGQRGVVISGSANTASF